jgi:hypothetical protein
MERIVIGLCGFPVQIIIPSLLSFDISPLHEPG